MRFDFKDTTNQKKYFVLERNVCGEWRAVERNYPAESVFDVQAVAMVTAQQLHDQTGDKYRVLEITKTISTSFKVDVVCEL